MLSELSAIIPATDLSTPPNTLVDVITRIANGVDPLYETNLKVNLSC